MSSTGEQAPAYAQPAPSGSAYVPSLVALAFGVVLAVGVSALFGVLGWGGELASQTAGAASGAAPLILDGVRQRRTRSQARPSLRALTRGLWRRYNKLWVASAFGFAVLIVDSAAGLLVWRLTRWTINLADGDPARFQTVYTLLGVVITLPAVLAGTYLLAIAAGHRLGERTRRWIALGMVIYAVVRTGTVLASSSSSSEMSISRGMLILGLVVSIPFLVLVALLGARRARRTQTAFYAQLYFRRLDQTDQEAALALLDETVIADPPPPAMPPAAVPNSAVGPPAPPRPEPR